MTGDLQKAASIGGKLLSGLKKFNDISVWKGVGKLADKRLANGGGAGARAVKGVANTMGSGLGFGLGAYGMTGMVMDLPGSQLAMNIGMPGWGLAATAPNVIRSGRMASQKNQDALKNDVMEGARYGADDFMTAVNSDPALLRNPDGFKNFMKQHTGDFTGDSYGPKAQQVTDLGTWRMLQGILGDSQGLIDQTTRRQIQQAMMGKQAGSKWDTAKAVGGGALALLGVGAAGAAAYDIGDSILGEKPYDADKAQQEGYAGAQAAIQKRLNEAKGWERLAMRLDPTLAVQGLERAMPGAVAHWQKSTGGKYTPGWLSSIHEAWRTGGKPSYYTTDAGGNSHYIS